ncbi:hypothetical protein LR48_Vigan406s000400, partial [Vigna angularis]
KAEKTFRIFQSQELELANKYSYVVSLWKRVSTVTGELRYVDVLRLLNTLEDASKRALFCNKQFNGLL